MAAAQQAFKNGIDEDWQASVQRYPEVLQYYYSLGPSVASFLPRRPAC